MSRDYSDPNFPWWVQCFYADNVKWPKRPGELAVETKHSSESSMLFEIEAAKNRKDIGEIISGYNP